MILSQASICLVRIAMNSGLCLVVAAMAQGAEAARGVYSLAGSTGSGIGATSSLGTIMPHELILRRSADS